MGDPNLTPLTIESLTEIVGADAFAAACAEALSTGSEVMESDVPHDLADRLWYDGPESLGERIVVAAALYRLMPCYANLMYWRRREFDRDADILKWDAFRSFLEDPSPAVGEPTAYLMWVDEFEDPSTVARAWHEVSGPQEPRRPRVERIVGASGPVPWSLKVPLYRQLSTEGTWNEPLFEGLFGSCIDIYGSLDRMSALRFYSALRGLEQHRQWAVLGRALADPSLPDSGSERRRYVSDLLKSVN